MAFVKVKECLTSPSQLIKLILLIICVCITIYQLSECVNKILNPPITSYYQFRYNATIKYPALTICRRPSFKETLFPKYGLRSVTSDLSSQNAFKFFQFNTYTLKDFTEEVSYNFSDMIPLYGFKGAGLVQNIDVNSIFYADRGLCHTISPKEPTDTFSVNTGYWFYLKHTTKDKSKDTNGQSTSGFEIHIHDENEIKDDISIDRNFLYLESAEDMHVTLSVQTYNQISTPQNPCIHETGYSKSKCEEECLHNFVAKQVGCQVPWLRHLLTDYPECTNYTLINQISNLLSDYKRKEILTLCYCPRPCNNSFYNYQIESRRDSDTIQAPSSTITLYFASNLITDLTEVISYDWNIFISDVGGSLGFLLGLSVIGIVNVFEVIVAIIFKQKNNKNEKIDNKQEINNFVNSEEKPTKF